MLLNFPIQGAGADILRAASSLMFDEGVQILALVHDAVLIEDVDGQVERAAQVARRCWSEASSSILSGFPLESDVEIVRYPHTFEPEGTTDFWNWLTELRQSIDKPGRPVDAALENHLQGLGVE